MVMDREKEWVAVAAQPVAVTTSSRPMARGGGMIEVREFFGSAMSKRFFFQDNEVSRLINLIDKVDEQTILMRKN